MMHREILSVKHKIPGILVSAVPLFNYMYTCMCTHMYSESLGSPLTSPLLCFPRWNLISWWDLEFPMQPGWPPIHRDPPVSASRVLGLKVCATTAWLHIPSLSWHILRHRNVREGMRNLESNYGCVCLIARFNRKLSLKTLAGCC